LWVDRAIWRSPYSNEELAMPTEVPKQPWQERIQETAARVEDELRGLATYINDEVVPDVRRYSSEALRTAALELHKLAQRMDDERGKTPPPPRTPGTGAP
jgi:hypothetical protein